MELVAESAPRFQIDLLLYTLIPNHYHFCLKQNQAYEVSGYLKEVCSRYARFFNRKYRRYGHLFASRFRAKVVWDEAGLLRLSHYIHMNPVRAGLAQDPAEWRFSSYADYIQGGKKTKADLGRILQLVGGVENYKRFMATYNPADALSIYGYMTDLGGPAEASGNR
jgi:REP element-mobilizing transposase RayT